MLKSIFWFACLAAASLATAQQAAPVAENPLAHARSFQEAEAPARTAANGAIGRSFLKGTLATGEAVGVHSTLQPAGTMPTPIHTIAHSEVIVVVEGTVTFDHDGLTDTAGPGSVLYIMPGTQHRLRNTSSGAVKYVVVQIGGDTRK